MKIINCRVNHITGPLGFMIERPVFSWNIADSEAESFQAKLTVCQDQNVIYETGWDDLDMLGTLADITPEPCTRYAWQVCVRDDQGEEAVSEVHYFETGMMDSRWQGKWITAKDNKEPRHPVFRRSFAVKEGLKKARLYVTALGLYEAWINGERTGKEYLTPFCTAYDRWLQVQTFDITGQLRNDNRIEIMLGNGWYRGRFGFDQKDEPAYGDTWKLLAEIHIEYENGEQEVIGTGEDWEVLRSNINFSNIYDGEIVDDTLPELPVEKAVVSEADVVLKDRLSPELKAREEFVPEILHTPKGETVFDLGQNQAGIFSMKVDEPYGTKIHLQFGEVLQDDCFYRDNLRTAKAEYVYISDGRPHVLYPHFTFYGYRYVKAEGLSDPEKAEFRGIALYSEIPERGCIRTGNALVNKLVSNTIWGMKSNYIDVPTDCPQRDERMGWTGDAQVFSETAMYLCDPSAFFTKYLYDMKEEQEKNDGLVPFTVPSFGIRQGACAWGDAATVIPMNMYLYNGDKEILRRQFGSMKAWVEYIRRVDGSDHGWRKMFHFGDWLALDGPQGDEAVKGATDDAFVADIYYLISTENVCKAAEVLGMQEETEEYRKLAEKIRAGILKEFYTPAGRCAVMTQTGQVLTWKEKLGDPGRTQDLLVRLLNDNGGRLATGFVGTPLLCDTLSEMGRTDLAYDLLLNEEYPGWLYEVLMGATTIWERWNSIDPEGHITGIGMNSLNHYSYGAVVKWIWAWCAGITAIEPGFRKALIRPVTDYRLGYLDAVYPSASGTYEVHWKVLDTWNLQVKIVIPAGCSAEVILPQAADDSLSGCDMKNMKPGTYEFSYRTQEPLKRLITLKTKVMNALKNEKIREYLENIPLFRQSEYSMQDMIVADGLAGCGIGKDKLGEIEAEMLKIQEEDNVQDK